MFLRSTTPHSLPQPGNSLAPASPLALVSLCLMLVAAMGGVAESPRVTSDAPTGVLDGRLTDTRSIPLSQATVVVRNLTTGAVAQSVTGKNGSYHFAGLGPGEYRLEASVPRLGNGAVDGILVWAGHVTRIQAALLMEAPSPPPLPPVDLRPIGPIDSAAPLDPMACSLSSQIPAAELASLPLASRDWTAFQPAAGPSPPSSAASNVAEQTTPPLSEISESSVPLTASLEEELDVRPSIRLEQQDAWDVPDEDREVEIFSVESRPVHARPVQDSPYRSDSAGPVEVRAVDATTGSFSSPGARLLAEAAEAAHSANRLHGLLSYSNRQSSWNALNPFTQWVRETAPASGIETAQFTAEPYSPTNARQAFEVRLGGQSAKKKLSWFVAADGLLRNDPAVATVRHPADFFAQPTDDSLQVLAARLNSSGPAILEAGAAAYSGTLVQMASLLGPVPRSSTRGQGLARLDAQLNERQHLSIDGNFTHLDAPGGARTRTTEMVGSHSFGNSQATLSGATARWEAFLTPNLLNALSGQFRLHVLRDTPQAPSSFEQPLIASGWGLLPEIIADSRNGFMLGKPAQLGRSNYPDEQIFKAQETLSWVLGRHLFRFGASLEHQADAVSVLVNQTGTYSYANVLNFVSDVASFEKYGLASVGNPYAEQHNCDQTGRVHRSNGVLLGLGYLPCYAWYTQRVGPPDWHLSTNQLAAFATDQWQPMHRLTLSASLRIETQQLPPPIASVANADLPAKLPSAMLNFAPRVGMAWSPAKGTVLRAGAGMYFGQVGSAALLATLTQTGSPHGDLNLFFKPTDLGAPPFPYVFMDTPPTVVTPGAVSFAGKYHLPEVDQALVSVEQEFPGHWIITAGALASLGRRLPISVDTNLNPAQGPESVTYAVVDALHAGPLKSAQVTVPFYTARLNANYQQLASIESRANSTYDAAMLRVTRSASHGLSLHAHYLYGHATDWNPNESSQVAVNDVLDPGDFRAEFGTSNLDIRHTAGLTVLFQTPWKLHNWAGALANAWSLGAIGQYRSGRPFTMRTGGYIPGFFDENRKLIEGVATGMNGSGGDNRVYGVGRNTYRYPATWTGDTRLAKRFELRNRWELSLLAESFNLFNHQNVTRIETTGYTIQRGSAAGELPTLNFLTGLTKAGLPSTTPEFGKPLDVNATNTYHPREFQLGLRARF